MAKQSFARKAGRIMLIALGVVLAVVALLVAALVVISPGKPGPMLDEQGKPIPGSLSEKVFANINGVEQGMFIKSKDARHPVLLYLHGGMPDYFLKDRYPTRLEDDFTVVWWEQRGSGISYHADIPRETMNAEQLIADTIAVTNYLRGRFGQDKIYLMGHSGGTFIAIQAAARAPELYKAYIGEAQLANQLKSEKEAYDYMLAKFKENGNRDMLKRLEAKPVTLEGGTPPGYDMIRDEAMHSLGIGTTHDMDSVITGILLPSWLNHDYTLGEKLNMWRGKAQSGISIVWAAMLKTDLSVQTPKLSIPVYFFHGIYDYTVSYAQAKAYFEKLQAPVKGFYTFQNSAHSPMFEEPDKMEQILAQDVLNGSNRLADPE